MIKFNSSGSPVDEGREGEENGTLLTRAWVVVAMLSALVLSVYRLGDAPLWLDEAHSFVSAHLPASAVPDALARANHPPAYFLLMHVPDYVPNSSGLEVVLSQLEDSVRHGRGAHGDEREAGKHLPQ